jgi:hypothetical protein
MGEDEEARAYTLPRYQRLHFSWILRRRKAATHSLFQVGLVAVAGVNVLGRCIFLCGADWSNSWRIAMVGPEEEV